MLDYTPPTAICVTCKREFPFTIEFFKPRKDAPSGLRRLCRQCHTIASGAAEKRRVAVRRAEQQQRIASEGKQCTKCGKKLPYTDAHFYRRTTGGLAAECKVCHNLRVREHYKIPEVRLRYLERSAISQKKRYVPRPKRLKTKDERRLTKRLAEQRRRTKKHGLPCSFTAQDWQHALEYFGNCCATCGRPPGLWHKLTPDHWIAVDDPRPDNPGTVPANIVPLCYGDGGCNNSKWKYEAEEWLVKKFGKQKAKDILQRIKVYFGSL